MKIIKIFIIIFCILCVMIAAVVFACVKISGDADKREELIMEKMENRK